MVFQNYALYPHMTVYDNMAFGLKLRKLPKEEIDRRVRRRPRSSGSRSSSSASRRRSRAGQRQRVAMGRAIVREPQAFLMDEPLSNLDAKLRVQMRAEVSRIQDELGVTTIYVTHDQIEAMTMGDRVAVIKKGELQQVDAPQFLYDHPANLFVAGFIGSPAMNMVEADLAARTAAVGVVRQHHARASTTRSSPSGPGSARTRAGGDRRDPSREHGGRVDRAGHPRGPADEGRHRPARGARGRGARPLRRSTRRRC